ncbi:MAG: sugar porter family MFS transporter [Steroidobacteraceae bacterium]|nr:sugar porter family MFS transporter [Steroidobacteraceae bacterium]
MATVYMRLGKVSTNHIQAVTGTSFVSALCWVLCGYYYAVMSGVVGALDHNLVAPRRLGETAAHLLLGIAVCSALFGTIAGSLLARQVAEKLGRKIPIIIAALLFLAASVGSAFPEIGIAPLGTSTPDALWPFMIYRFLGGVAVALASFVAPMYVSEFAPSAGRGQIGAYQQIAIGGGICMALCVNWGISLQGDDAWLLDSGWRYMNLALSIPAMALFCMSFTVPESPVWLVRRGRRDEARRAIERSAEPEEVRAAMDDLEASANRKPDTSPVLSFGLRVLFVGVAINILQQFIGLTAISYYGPQILQRLGFHADEAFLGVLFARSLNMVATLGVVLVVDRVGRKPLLIFGSIVMGLSMLVLGSLMQADSEPMLGLIAMCCYMIGLGLSFGPIVWIMLSEIFPAPIRAKATSIAMWAQWGANLVLAVTFPWLFGSSAINAVTHGALPFWIYAGFAFVAGFVVLQFVPETKGIDQERLGAFWTRQNRKTPTPDAA